jgi:hypothetical protein
VFRCSEGSFWLRMVVSPSFPTSSSPLCAMEIEELEHKSPLPTEAVDIVISFLTPFEEPANFWDAQYEYCRLRIEVLIYVDVMFGRSRGAQTQLAFNIGCRFQVGRRAERN